MGFSPSREAVYRTVAVLAAMVGAIVSCEQVARWLHPEATRATILERIERERYRWKQPDENFHHVGNGIYSLRFPAREDGPQRRVMIVGDSFAMGHGVGEEERFGALLQRSLGDSTTVDVLAASSYSPVTYRNIVDRSRAGPGRPGARRESIGTPPRSALRRSARNLCDPADRGLPTTPCPGRSVSRRRRDPLEPGGVDRSFLPVDSAGFE